MAVLLEHGLLMLWEQQKQLHLGALVVLPKQSNDCKSACQAMHAATVFRSALKHSECQEYACRG